MRSLSSSSKRTRCNTAQRRSLRIEEASKTSSRGMLRRRMRTSPNLSGLWSRTSRREVAAHPMPAEANLRVLTLMMQCGQWTPYWQKYTGYSPPARRMQPASGGSRTAGIRRRCPSASTTRKRGRPDGKGGCYVCYRQNRDQVHDHMRPDDNKREKVQYFQRRPDKVPQPWQRRSMRHLRTSEPKYQDHAAGMPCQQDTPGSQSNSQGSAQRRGHAQARGDTLQA